MAMTPSVRSPRRPLADASLVAKSNQVRTMVQHDWSMPEAPDQFQQLPEANEYHWKPRNVHQVKRRDVEVARPSGVARRSSRAEPHSRDQLAPSTDMESASYALRLRSAVPSHKPKRSLTRDVDGLPPRSGRKRLSSPPADQQLRALGAWSESSLVHHKGIPAEFLGDDERYLTAPSPPLRSPGYARLPTPDLVPISGDHEFCSCCVDTPEEVDKAWYRAGRAKMDAQRKFMRDSSDKRFVADHR